MSHLIRKGNSYTFWTVSGVKPCFKILDSAVGGTKALFNTYLVEKGFFLFPHFLGIAKEYFQITDNLKEVEIALIRP